MPPGGGPPNPVEHEPFWAGRSVIEVAAIDPVLSALPSAVTHNPTTNALALAASVRVYVVAADVYAVAPHTGRGGWTWYTGSAGWMYRLLLETLLGVNLEGNQLRLTPSLPRTWNTFTLHYRYRQTPYHIRVTRLPVAPLGGSRLSLDGQALTGNVISLQDDRHDHSVELQVS